MLIWLILYGFVAALQPSLVSMEMVKKLCHLNSLAIQLLSSNSTDFPLTSVSSD